jgi:phage recombination protein Bet
MSNVVAVSTPQKSVLVDMASRYGMEPKIFADALKATVVPKDVSNEQFAAFLLVAKQYELNPLTKEIYAFPTRGGGIQPIVSIDGWANLINSHPAMDGLEFHDQTTDKGELLAVTCRIFRKDRSRPIEATEYMVECRRNTDTWRQWPRRMLRHKAMIQAARYAFGFAGIIEPDEWERSPERPSEAQVTPPSPPPAPKVVPLPPAAEAPAEDLTGFYERLEGRMADAATVDEVDAVWSEEAVEDTCGDDLTVAEAIRAKRIREIGGHR